MQHLFVYGTLRRASPHPLARRLASEADFVGPGRTRGRLYKLGWYPGMILSADPGDWVIGDVYRLHDPDALLPILDEYEGEDFARVAATVSLADGAEIQAWVYVYLGQPDETNRIASY